ncbi:MAG: cytochrome P450 [Myxococcota bacterium]
MSIDYDPFSLDCRSEPYAYYARLRDEAPVYWAEAAQMFVVARYEDVVSILTDPDRFSNDAMASVLAIGGARASKPGAPQMPGVVVTYDPPDHTRLRKIVNRAFTPRRVESWRAIVEAETRAAIDRMKSADSFDIIADLASPLPSTIIAHVLGIGPEHRDDFKRRASILSAAMTGSLRSTDPVESGAVQAAVEQGQHLAGVIAERRAAPRDDIVSDLTRAQGEEILTPEETLGFTSVLTFAGAETTTNLIGNAVRVLVERPDLYERVVADPSRIDALLEETLRWDTPVQYIFRRATEDVEIAGTKIPKDGIISLLAGSANRDPGHWGESAEAFDLDRSAAGHLGFGLGIHFCIGAALARMEAQVALRELLPLLRESEFVGHAFEPIDSVQFRGVSSLRFRRSESAGREGRR